MMPNRLRSGFVVGAAIALLSGACSVPTETTATVIPAEKLPESLRPGFTTTTTTLQAPILTTATIYLLTRQAETARPTVVEVTREVPLNPSMTDIISRLFGEGTVTTDEEAANYITTLSEFELLSAKKSGDTAIIDIVNLTPEGLPSDQPFEGDLIDVAAQLVWTATAIDGIESVQILIGSEEETIPTNTGDTEIGATVTRADYELFDPNYVLPSTTTTSSTTSVAPSTTGPPTSLTSSTTVP